jgi:2-iminobutanoate/2-iminopropanoate deaminase
MSKTAWISNANPAPPHPFAHFVANEDWVLVSGIGGHDAEGNISESVDEQAIAAFEKIKLMLESRGSNLSEVVWFTPYITDRADALAVDEVIRKYLSGTRTASAALTIVGLVDPRMKVEFDVWAYKGAVLTEDSKNVFVA